MFITDKKLFATISSKKYLDMKSSRQKELDRARSYSYFLTKGDFRKREIIPLTIKRYLQKVRIDYTEDEHLRVHYESSHPVSE